MRKRYSLGWILLQTEPETRILSKWFTWEVIPGSIGKRIGKGDREEKEANLGCSNEQVTTRASGAQCHWDLRESE